MFRPYGSLLLVVFLMTAADTGMFNQTRTHLLGPYLNLADVCVLIALGGFLFDKYRTNTPIRLPTILPLFAVVLIIAAIQSFWKLGWTYETLRAIRWTLDVPIGICIGANMVTTPKRAKHLAIALFCGAVAAALQHICFAAVLWRTKGLSMETYHLVRTISFWGGCMGSALLAAAVIYPLPRALVKRAFCLVAGFSLAVSVILNQTRSLWLGTIGAAGGLGLYLKPGRWPLLAVKSAIVLVIVIVCLVQVGNYLMPGLDISAIIEVRMTSLLHGNSLERKTVTRENAMRAEFGDWMQGTLLFGRGLNYFQTAHNSRAERYHIAYGHLGYFTYLSQTGVLGLLVYGLVLPFQVIKNGRWLWLHSESPDVRFIGLLSMASILCLSIMFIASSHFLCLGYFAPAVLYGAGYVLARPYRGRGTQADSISVVGSVSEE